RLARVSPPSLHGVKPLGSLQLIWFIRGINSALIIILCAKPTHRPALFHHTSTPPHTHTCTHTTRWNHLWKCPALVFFTPLSKTTHWLKEKEHDNISIKREREQREGEKGKEHDNISIERENREKERKRKIKRDRD